MCGIVGYVGTKDAATIVFDGLKKLEYRGYDSAGIASVNGDLDVRRAEGKLINLETKLRMAPLAGYLAIGHTRWATHGAPIERNAHPHADETNVIAVVQNGIVENFMALRAQLEAEGHEFKSDTDTEVITHLVDKFLTKGDGLEGACRRAFSLLQGAHAIAVVSKNEPDKIIAVKLGNAGGVIVGLGENENYLASDIPAILEHTQKVIYLEDREMAVITAKAVYFTRLDDPDTTLEKLPHEIDWAAAGADKGLYTHFMEKEIMDQPQSIQSTIRGRLNFVTGEITLEQLNLSPQEAAAINRIVIVSCGTSSYAGIYGKMVISKLAKIPTSVEYASEFRYSDPLVDENTIVLVITQSGETADTLAAMAEAKAKGAKVWSIVNVHGSAAYRDAHGKILMQVGPEIGVASTKAFTATLVDLFMLGMYLGQQRGVLSSEQSRKYAQSLALLPNLVGKVLASGYNDYSKVTRSLRKVRNALFLGRGLNYAIAMEGSIKLKEISYIHAEGYPAGEMKHGPIALIDDKMLVVCIVLQDDLRAKMISQVEQVRARDGIVLSIINEGDAEVTKKSDLVLHVPATEAMLMPVLAVLPLQLLAYYMAVARGCDVDQPRNLAKSVTVE
jgi:glutamine---fructose-6-phosphate transaminase (isomerizing)